MLPLNKKIDFKYKGSKGLDTENEVYHKYGKDYLIRDYINEFREGTNAKEIIKKAGGLNNLPHAMERIKDSNVVIDMNEDIFTINRKLKIGAIAQRKIDAQKEIERKAAYEAAQAAAQAAQNTGKEE